jgi:hypothetical protein
MPQYMTGLRGPIPRRMTSGQGKQGKHVRSLSCLGTLTSKKNGGDFRALWAKPPLSVK